jgi:hypothetical protein
MYPEIGIHFSIFCPTPLDIITNLLDVQPKRQSIIIPEPLYYWSLDTNRSFCRCLEEKLGEMISMLEPKIEALKQLIKNYEVDLSFIAVIVMEDGDAPELFFSKETIALLASLNAQFACTIYEP